MTNKIRFNAIIERNQEFNAAYIRFPFDTQELFGIKGQVKIKATFDGKVEYRGSLANMGLGCHILGITKEIRSIIDKSFGDTISIEIERDLEERTIAIPDYLLRLLDENHHAKEYFSTLSYTDKKEYIRWIETAKKEETRTKRIGLFIDKLSKKKKFSDK